MRNTFFHLIVLFGAVSNIITMTMSSTNIWIVIGSTVLYVLIFEGVYLLLKPRILQAERKGNLRKYPFLTTLMENEKSTIELVNGEKIYNAKFKDYSSPQEVKKIDIEIMYPKQAKRQAYTEIKQLHLVQIQEVKAVKQK